MKHMILALTAVLTFTSVTHAYEWQNPNKVTDEGRERLLVSARTTMPNSGSADRSVCFSAGLQVGYNRALLEQATNILRNEKTSAEDAKQASEAVVILDAKIKAQNSMIDYCLKSSI